MRETDSQLERAQSWCLYRPWRWPTSCRKYGLHLASSRQQCSRLGLLGRLSRLASWLGLGTLSGRGVLGAQHIAVALLIPLGMEQREQPAAVSLKVIDELRGLLQLEPLATQPREDVELRDQDSSEVVGQPRHADERLTIDRHAICVQLRQPTLERGGRRRCAAQPGELDDKAWQVAARRFALQRLLELQSVPHENEGCKLAR
mmetsp:Transcript_9310/g.24315  ORF Transcript_9310/g.24315 Transcript_9310/m.24315 type:complete len:203 (-) Transcript_9310:671-1279(-)